MKRADDPRHIKRIKLFQELFAFGFHSRTELPYKDVVSRIKKHLAQIDPLIERVAPTFPVEKIAKTDLAILRLALFEFLIEKQQPAKVIIDEAIELAKEFGGEGSPAFINGVLGTLFAARLKS